MFVDGRWVDAASFEFDAPDRGPDSLCTVAYAQDYVLDLMESGADDHSWHWIAARYPATLAPRVERPWPVFLDELRPAGAAGRWWVDRLGLRGRPPHEWPHQLLLGAAVAPVGNLRIAEAVPKRESDPERFPDHALDDRDTAFVDYAFEHGAVIAGATGPGGEAPKVCVRQNDDWIWIDPWQDAGDDGDWYLVKFARGARTAADCDVLRSEYVYLQALSELGFETCLDNESGTEVRLKEGAAGPSLWMPRFDVGMRDGQVVRFGVESLFSLGELRDVAFARHQTYLAALHEVLCSEPGYDRDRLTAEYVCRDLLNDVFGNTDNHGGNTSLIRRPEGMWLAPIYDFAPMRMDPDLIIRTTRWEGTERGGVIDWRRIPESVAEWGDPGAVYAALRALAERLADLPERLARLGLPEATFRSIPRLERTAQWLTDQGLL